MRYIRSILCGLLIFAMALGLFPGFTMSSTAAAATAGLELHAFYPSQMTLSDQTKAYIDALDSVSFAWGRLYGDLSEGVNTTLGKNGNTLFYYPQDYVDVLTYAKSKGKTIQLSLFSDSVNAEKILPYQEQRKLAVDAIVKLLSTDATNGEQIFYDGVVIDIEGLQNKELIGGKTTGAWYSQFLRELKTELLKIGKKQVVAVNPLLNYTGYDYKAISETADKMIVMAHDYEPVTKLNKGQILQYTGYDSASPIDSLAPIKKIQLALEDVKKYVSKTNQGKVMLQISFDAAQWRYPVATGATWQKTSKQAMSLETRNTPTYQMIYDRVINKDKKGSAITYGYNNELQSPFIQYLNVADNTYNILLYENGKSVGAKIDLAKQYGIGGISLWSLANIPDYNDTAAKAYGLNVWNSILATVHTGLPPVTQTKFAFADKVVETAIRKQLQKTTGAVYKSDLLRVYRLKVPAGYKSLNDLKGLTNLEYLDLSGTKLSSVASLASLKNLRVLYLQRNTISDITSLKGLTKLQILSLNGNKVSNITALTPLIQLTELYLRENLIKDFSPLTRLSRLNVLYIGLNKSTNYSALKTLKKNLVEFDF